MPVTVTHRLPGATRDEYGNEIPNEETLETVGELQQTRRAEPGDAGETSVADFLLILPAGTLLATGDTVTVDGQDYEVVGDPDRKRNPRLRLQSHVEATVRRAAGAEDAS
jgi:hypothetical protein